jgi:exoribonuclease R
LAAPAAAGFELALDRVLARLGVPAAFPADVEAEAEAAARRRPPELPDRTDLPFISLDPPGSRDIDQLLYLVTRGSGYRLYYAIAYLPWVVAPGGAVDAEARRRGQTLYPPGRRVPLHPPVLSEGAASLLADGVARPAAVWQIDLDDAGAVTGASVERALVRNRAQLAYGEPHEQMALVEVVGKLRQAQEAARGGVSLNVPEQTAEPTADGWRLAFRRPAAVELWNAQLSLLTGSVAARLMLDAGVGLLRTLPPAEPAAVDRLRRTAKALHIPWPKTAGYPEFVRSLDPAAPHGLAMLNACRRLFRGSGYRLVSEVAGDPEAQVHAAVALPYAHVTAPLRRLVDRFTTEVCLAVTAGAAVPDWVLAGLPELPPIMAESTAQGSQVEAAAINLLEAFVLQDRVGDEFEAVVTGYRDKTHVTIQVADPAIEASVEGRLDLGATIQVRLVEANTAAGTVRFAV